MGKIRTTSIYLIALFVHFYTEVVNGAVKTEPQQTIKWGVHNVLHKATAVTWAPPSYTTPSFSKTIVSIRVIPDLASNGGTHQGCYLKWHMQSGGAAKATTRGASVRFLNPAGQSVAPNIQPSPQMFKWPVAGWVQIPGTVVYQLEITYSTAPPQNMNNDFSVVFTAQHEGNGAGSAEMLRVNIGSGFGQAGAQQAQNQGGAQQTQNQSGSQQNQNQTGSQQTFQQQWQQLQQQQLGSRIQGRGSAIILRRRFNPKTGKVEVTMNGIISRKGYLNLMGKDLNRRQALRNYRYR